MKKQEANQQLLDMGIVPTESFVDVYRKVSLAVNKRSILVVTGEPGMGKTTIKRVTLGRYKEDVSDFIVIEPEAGLVKQKDSTSAIMSLMIDQIMNEKPRRDVITKAEQLKRGLKETQRKIILSIDEAQELGMDSLYGIKKLHELGGNLHREFLFAITLFGKPVLRSLVSPPELKNRVTLYNMKAITKDELHLFLQVYDIRLQKKQSFDQFANVCGLIPLEIKVTCNAIQALTKTGLKPDEALNRYVAGDLRILFKKTKLSYSQLANMIFAATGRNFDKSTIGRAIKGESATPEADMIRKFAAEKAGEVMNDKG